MQLCSHPSRGLLSLSGFPHSVATGLLQGPNFEFLEKEPGSAPYLAGLYAFNYSALASQGLSASALSGAQAVRAAWRGEGMAW